MKRAWIWLAVIGVPLFNAAAFLSQDLQSRMMAAIVLLAGFFAAFALLARRRFDFFLALSLMAIYAASSAVFPDVDQRTLALRTSSVTAFVFLNLVLLIGSWSRFSETVRGWYRHRRHLGVTAYFLAQLHFILVLQTYFQGNLANAFMALFTFFGFTGYFILFFLAVTSWDWMQKHIGTRLWKRIHLGVFVLYAASAGYAFWLNLSNHLPIEPWQWGALSAFFIVWYLMAPWGYAPKLIKQINGWKQLHVLIHIAFASIVLHAWFGVVQAQPVWVQALFLGIVTFTWGSHLYGWRRKLAADKRLADEAAKAVRIEVDGKPYWSAGVADTFEEGKGKRILVNGNPIAVFKHLDKFFGLYAVCAHQKGPIEQGKIVNGYVECPWHGWQYGCGDGKGPPGFEDRLGFYPCVVKEGVVYVSQSPKRAS